VGGQSEGKQFFSRAQSSSMQPHVSSVLFFGSQKSKMLLDCLWIKWLVKW